MRCCPDSALERHSDPTNQYRQSCWMCKLRMGDCPDCTEDTRVRHCTRWNNRMACRWQKGKCVNGKMQRPSDLSKNWKNGNVGPTSKRKCCRTLQRLATPSPGHTVDSMLIGRTHRTKSPMLQKTSDHKGLPIARTVQKTLVYYIAGDGTVPWPAVA